MYDITTDKGYNYINEIQLMVVLLYYFIGYY